MYYPGGMKARVSPVQSIEPHRILASTRDSNQEPPGPQSEVVTTILLLHTNKVHTNKVRAVSSLRNLLNAHPLTRPHPHAVRRKVIIISDLYIIHKINFSDGYFNSETNNCYCESVINCGAMVCTTAKAIHLEIMPFRSGGRNSVFGQF